MISERQTAESCLRAPNGYGNPVPHALLASEDDNSLAAEEQTVNIEDDFVMIDNDDVSMEDDTPLLVKVEAKAEDLGVKVEDGVDAKSETSLKTNQHPDAMSIIPRNRVEASSESQFQREPPALSDSLSMHLHPLHLDNQIWQKTGSQWRTQPDHACYSLDQSKLDKQGVIVKIRPPTKPEDPSLEHVPCDIVLVIDVSGSMGTRAPVPGSTGSEGNGMTILHLVQHAALTILETMNAGDRLGIVTFSSEVKVLQGLTAMNGETKETCRRRIREMKPEDMTNMWGGITTGLGLFEDGDLNTGRVPALMVLTDGQPNIGDPPRGYVQMLKMRMPLAAQIHTFGFGYNLYSGLLKAIAEIGGGNYAFIPDSSMLGTVFIHAVANLQSTYASKATLKLSYPRNVVLEETTGPSVAKLSPQVTSEAGEEFMQMTIHLGNIQYGQTRDIFLKISSDVDSRHLIHAELEYQRMTSEVFTIRQHANRHGQHLETPLSREEECYHISRAMVCEFLGSFFPLQNDQHTHLCDISKKQTELEELAKSIPAHECFSPRNQSLVQELQLQEPRGQIALAVMNDSYYKSWGRHYLLSLQNAHERQMCNSFKDPGPLQYGLSSPLFQNCRDRLDHAFDTIKSPVPDVEMKEYRQSSSSCFAAGTPVRLASGRTVPIRRLRRGMRVSTPMGPRTVAVVLKTPVRRELVCRVGGVLVTPWHPVSVDGKSWTFPAMMEGASLARYSGPVFSVMLGRDECATAHAIHVGGVWGVTLGHGLKAGVDVRSHAFLGDYERVKKALMGVGVGREGIVLSSGVARDPTTGLLCGFKRYSREVVGEHTHPRLRKL